MLQTKSKITAVIVNNMGGITTLIQNLVLNVTNQNLEQEVILLNIEGNKNTNAFLEKGIVHDYFCINPINNWYYTYGKLASFLSKASGVLVSNDQYDLIMLQAFNIPKFVVQIVHDTYNLELSIKFNECIDIFIAHSLFIYELLQQKLPNRLSDIYHIHYGIPIESFGTKKININEPLKLLFIGRHSVSKGVLELFEIDKILKRNNIYVEWNILGNGPETEILKNQWNESINVHFTYCNNQIDVLEEAFQSDILVFPTKFEGFPVALLEAMSMGCVPVVTNLQGGIQEIVEDGVTGFKCPINNVEAFANKIIFLHNNRDQLFLLQTNAALLVRNNFNAAKQMPKYQNVFLALLENNSLPKHHAVTKKIGSRLDQFWIPNSITRLLRKSIYVK